MSEKLFKRLEKFRTRHNLSILAFCRQLETSHVNYHRWKKARQIVGPYKKIIEDFLDRNEKSQALQESSIKSSSDIAVIGMSCYYPGAANIKELWENILARRVQFRRMLDSRLPLSEYYDSDPKSPEKMYITKAALIENFNFDWAKWRIPKKTFESTDIVHWLALDTALKAFEDAGYKSGEIPLQNTGVVVGNTLTGEQTRSQTLRLRWPYVRKTLDITLDKLGLTKEERHRVSETMEGIYKSAFYPMTEDSLAGGLANTIAGRICNYLNLKGGGYIVDGACSSSLLAIATAANALKMKDVDLALAGGVDISLDPFELVGFSRAGALAKDKMQVYDRNASGFIPGEGCGFVVLKRLEDALRDKNYIYSVIRGWGISSDGKGGIMEPSSNGQALAIERAYKNVPYKITEINFIEGHGTGTAKGDRVELEGIASAIAKQKPKDSKRVYGITSFKSIVGHTKAAAGVGGFIKAVMAANQRILPPTANCLQPNEIFEGIGKSLYPIRDGVVLDVKKEIRGGISSAGFGGINCHIAIESKDQPKKELEPAINERALFVSHQESEVFVFASRTVGLLKNLIGKFKDDLHFISQAEMADLSHRLAKNIKKNAPVKLAVVTDSPENLYQALCLIEQELLKDIPEGQTLRIKSSVANTQILLSNKPKQARIGFLYPGQASQRLNMTRVLFERFEWTRELASVTKTPIAQFIYKSSDQFLTKEERAEFEKELFRTEITQLAVTFSSLVWTEFLAKLGIEPDVVSGHSLGELTAFYKAGAFTKQELLKFAEFRGKSMVASGKKAGGMVSLLCSITKAKELVHRVMGNLVVANINSLSQIVVSGDKADIERLIKEAKKEDIPNVLLPVSNAFHSNFMQNASSLIKEHKSLRKSFKPSRVDLYSCMDGKKITGGAVLNDYFSRQVISQVNFVELVESMSKECDIFIEVGPGRVLTELVKSINADKGPLCLPVEGSVGNDRDLNFILAELFVGGVPIRWDELYKNRMIRPFIPVFKRKFIVNQCERPLKVPDNIGRTKEDYQKVIQGVIDLLHPEKGLAEVSEVQSQENLPSSSNNGRVADTLIHYVEKLTGFNKESLGLNLRLLDDLNLDSIKAAELIAEVAKALGVPGEIEPAQYSNRTLDEIRQKFEELVSHKHDGKLQANTQTNILKRYGDKLWVRNFVEKMELQQLGGDKTAVSKTFKNVLIISEEEKIANLLKENFKNTKVRILQADEIDVQKKPECVIAILSSDITKGLDLESLRKEMERLHKIISLAANSQYVLFAQLGSGDFKDGNIRAIASTLHLERPDLFLRIVDFHKELKGPFIAERIKSELLSSEQFAIAAYNAKGERQVPIFEISNPASYKKRNIKWSSKDVVLVTGGAKGITAECALEFSRQYKTKMILVGRSVKDAEIEKTLQRFKEEKLICEYVPCDVSDRDQVKVMIKDIEKRFGKVTAVIHGAGLNSLRRLKQANLEDVYREALPKVIGAVNILDTVKGDSLKLFAAMASIIGVTGMEASGWYGFANEILVNYLRNFLAKNQETQIIAPAFSVWDEVGMGRNLGSIEKLSERGIGAIPVAEGVARFGELIEGNPQAEQVIVTSRIPGLDTFQLREFKQGQDWRFIEQVKYCVPQVELIVQANLNTKDDTYVLDHNWKGSLLFPMVFGLEAMTQAACYVTATEKLQSLRIKNINLERPISVSPDSGTNIEIHAQVLENRQTHQVKVEIYCEQTNYKEPHFSAVLELNNTIKAIDQAALSKGKTQTPIDLYLDKDVYGPILFQGKMFQRLKQVNSLFYDDKKKKGECLFESEYNPLKESLLTDPYFFDSILQSMQLIIPQDLCLPREIEEIECAILNKSSVARLRAESIIERIDEAYYRGDAQVVQDKIILKIKNCRLKVLDAIPDNPSANDLVDPSARDQKIIEAKLAELSKEFDFNPPIVRCLHDQRLIGAKKDLRHKIELPLIRSAVGNLFRRENKTPPRTCKIRWTSAGKPILEGKELKNVGVSVSHDGAFLLVVAGYGKQGIDLETIQSKSKNDWKGVLGRKPYEFLEKICANDKDFNDLGTAIWCSTEATRKISHEDNFSFENIKKMDDLNIFEINHSKDKLEVFTLKLRFTQGRRRIFAFIPDIDGAKISRNSGASSVSQEMGYDKNVFDMELEHSGPQGQVVYVKRFPVTFKSNQNLSRSVYFTNFYVWMGEIREYGLYPIMKKLAELTETGGWGIATNYAKTKILGELWGRDVVEVRLWMVKSFGLHDSTFDWMFEWRKVLSNGKYERVAISELRTTWVRITGHGEAKIEAMPNFIRNFMDSMKPRKADVTKLDELPQSLDNLSLGGIVLQNDVLSHDKFLLHEELIKTSLEESNLVGNIYFANYAKWLGKTRDLYLYQASPEYFKGIGEQGELLGLTCDVNHLQEAMPFDSILVRMYLETLFENGFSLYFEFFKVEKDKDLKKLASAMHKAIWIKRVGLAPVPCRLPDHFRQILLKENSLIR